MPERTFGEIVVATLAALLSAAVAFLIGVFGGMEFGQHFTDGEGRAWSGISVGIPLGLLLALVAGYWTCVRVLKYGDPPVK